MIFQCKKDMLRALKREPEAKPDIYNDLFSWNVKLMKVGRRNLVYLMNDVSKLSIILYGMTAKEFKSFEYHVENGIRKVLEDCRVPSPNIHQYLEQSVESTFCLSGTRKQLGVLNRAAMEMEYYFEKFAEDALLQRRLCGRQNSSIVKNDNGDYVTPKVNMKNLLEKAYSNSMVAFDLGEIVIHMFVDDRMGIEPFLDIRDGSIRAVEQRTEEYEDIKCNDDYVRIGSKHFDFFHNFSRFARDIDNTDF